MKDTISQQELKETLDYNKSTGVFRWKSYRNWRSLEGSVAGTVKPTGYRDVKLFGKIYKAHRLAWLYVYGEFPPKHMDHINHMQDDNRVSNLRCVNVKENMLNKSMYHSNKSGVVGVNWHEKSNKWQAQIMGFGKKVSLGYFALKADAVEARQKAEIKFGFHANHGSI